MTSPVVKEVLTNIIQIYKEMPHLWKKDHPQYLNQEMRNESYKVLLEIYKNFDEHATIKMLKKKIENMRTNYIKELKKIAASKQSGSKEVHTPSLWYFDAFNFLGPQTETIYALGDPLNNETSQNISSSDEDAAPSSVASMASSCSGTPKRKKKDNLLMKRHKIFCSPENISQNEEECEIFGRSIGIQMKDLNKRQLFIAQKIISDVIFNAKLERLSEDSYVVFNPKNPTFGNGGSQKTGE